MDSGVATGPSAFDRRLRCRAGRMVPILSAARRRDKTPPPELHVASTGARTAAPRRSKDVDPSSDRRRFRSPLIWRRLRLCDCAVRLILKPSSDDRAAEPPGSAQLIIRGAYKATITNANRDGLTRRLEACLPQWGPVSGLSDWMPAMKVWSGRFSERNRRLSWSRPSGVAKTRSGCGPQFRFRCSQIRSQEPPCPSRMGGWLNRSCGDRGDCGRCVILSRNCRTAA